MAQLTSFYIVNGTRSSNFPYDAVIESQKEIEDHREKLELKFVGKKILFAIKSKMTERFES